MSTRPLRTFTIVPSIPESLNRLREVALNLRWAWDRETRDLFRRLDPELWETSRHNPVLMLGSVRQERLDEAAADDGYVAQYRRACERLDRVHGARRDEVHQLSDQRVVGGVLVATAAAFIVFRKVQMGRRARS